MHLLQENTWATGNQAIVMGIVTVTLIGTRIIVTVITATATVTTAGETEIATVIRMEGTTGLIGVIAEALHLVATHLSIGVVVAILAALQEVVAHLATENTMLRYRMVLVKAIVGRRYRLLCFILCLALQGSSGEKPATSKIKPCSP